MKIYLMRHGDYNKLHPQDLSELGKMEIEKIGSFLRHKDLGIREIYHSEKLRAQESAQLIAQVIQFKGAVSIKEGLQPMDDIDAMAYELNQAKENKMLVGHMPFLGKLVSKLLTGEEGFDLIAFNTGSMVCLERTEETYHWVIKWMVDPLALS